MHRFVMIAALGCLLSVDSQAAGLESQTAPEGFLDAVAMTVAGWFAGPEVVPNDESHLLIVSRRYAGPVGTRITVAEWDARRTAMLQAHSQRLRAENRRLYTDARDVSLWRR